MQGWMGLLQELTLPLSPGGKGSEWAMGFLGIRPTGLTQPRHSSDHLPGASPVKWGH